MTSAQKIEVALRAGLLMKDVAELIGCKDATLARLVVRQIIDRLKELAELVDGLK